MSDYYSRTRTIPFESAATLEKYDVAWIRWDHYRHGSTPAAATPTEVVKVYDDGNIIHKREGYDDVEFAFANDVIAKTVGVEIDNLPYRTVKISEIEDVLYERTLEEANNDS